MKKLLSVLATGLILFSFSACTSEIGENFSNSESAVSTPQEMGYEYVLVNWPIRKSAQELCENADLVLIGKVTGISFQVMDMSTGAPPTEEAKKQYRSESGTNSLFQLVTLYDLDVSATCKGEPMETTQIYMMGGRQDYRMDEQLDAMREYGIEDFPVFNPEMPKLEIGQTYLLLIMSLSDGSTPTTLNPHQAVYNLHNPFETNPVVEQQGYPDITAKDIISYFGADKWDAFWTQWQQDNPDWETWIDLETGTTAPTET